MNKILLNNIKEAALSVFPIVAVIIILNFVIPSPMSAPELIKFLIGALLLTVGIILYSLGSKTALEPIGENIGNTATSTKKIWVILLVGFFIGFIVTVAEPDLMVLGEQFGSIKWTLILTIAVGVGIFLLIALLRIVKRISLNYTLIALYGVMFILAVFAKNNYIPLAFDSGGVTTGPITVPFILAIGIGVASSLGGKIKKEDSFGIVAICSIGPIISVLLLSIIFKPNINPEISTETATTVQMVFFNFIKMLPTCLKEVGIALLPITAVYFIVDFAFIKTPKKRLARIIIGLIYTYIGLSLFLLGANVGFMSTGFNLGQRLAAFDFNGILIPIGMVIGCFLVLAEPAVHVLSKQVEEISNGGIKKKTLLFTLCISMALAIGLSMFRILTKISIWYFVVPGYIIALGLSFFVPKVYMAVAFDSGGVVSGPMTTTFMLPLAIGASQIISGNYGTLLYAYGLVSLVALTPLISIQLLGLTATLKAKRASIAFDKIAEAIIEGDIIELNSEREFYAFELSHTESN